MTGAPLPVREFTSAAEMRAHYAALHRKCFQTNAAQIRQNAARHLAKQIAAGTDLAARELVEPGPSVPVEPEPIPETVDTGLPPTTAQRETGAILRGSDCLRIVSKVTGITQTAMKSDTRIARVVKARQIAMWLLTKRAGKSLPDAGRFIGGKDHTTVLHACKRVGSVALPVSVLHGDAVTLAAALWEAEWPSKLTRARACR